VSDNILKKEFREKDVQRIRNIVGKKYGDKTSIQTGYTKAHIDHKEGDIWEENGKNWTLKNGIKMTISKLDLVKKLLQTPLTCPNCGKAMKKKQLDPKMYSIHKKCFDCVIEFETKLRLEGKYEEYASNLMSGNIRSYVDDLEQMFEEFMNENNSENIVTENGEIEVWEGNIDRQKLTKEFKEYLEKLKAAIQG
jgi:hypothetical protein